MAAVRGYGEHARPLLVKRAAKARALRYSAGNVRVDFVVKGLKKMCMLRKSLDSCQLRNMKHSQHN